MSAFFSSELFTADYLRAIEPLRLHVGPLAANTGHGEHRQPHAGVGAEFRDYQNYTPGDDLRRVDWNIYRRTGHLFLRRFDTLDPVPVYVLVDVSASMSFEDSPKQPAALRIAGAVAAAALRQQDKVYVLPFGSEAPAALEGQSGRNRVTRVLDYLRGLSAGGSTDFVGAIQNVSARMRRRGIAVVISDFLDEAGIERVTGALGLLQHRLVMVRLSARTDLEPVAAGSAELVDCELGARAKVDVTSETLRRYRAVYEQYTDQLADFAARRGAHYHVVDAELTAVQQLAQLFPNGIMTV